MKDFLKSKKTKKFSKISLKNNKKLEILNV
jgi:hypothetical protein